MCIFAKQKFNKSIIMANVVHNFEIIVWYRFSKNGEMENEFDSYEIEAETIQDAVNKVSEYFKTLKAIPFQYLYNGEKYKPNN